MDEKTVILYPPRSVHFIPSGYLFVWTEPSGGYFSRGGGYST